MTFLTPRDVPSVSQTCRLLRILSSCSPIWKVFYFSNRGWRINQEAAQQHVDVSHDSTMIASGQSADRSSFDSPMGCRAGHVLNNWPETPHKKPLSRLISSPSRGKSARQTSETPPHRRVDDPQNAILDWHTIYKERTELERRWQSGEPAQVTVLQVHDDAVYCCYLLGRTIITGSRDHSIKFWDHEVGIGGDPKLLHHIPEAHRLSVLCIQVDPGDLKHRGVMVTGSSDANITVWALRGFLHGNEKQCLGAQNTLRDASKSEKPKQVVVLTGHKAGVLDLLLSPDNTKIVSCSQDATIKSTSTRSSSILR
jgi:WD40 repeat protein